MTTKKIFGPPGTGKTTRLLDIMEKYLEEGGNPARLAFISFTKKAVAEAKARVYERFGIHGEDLPLFRTYHSMAFKYSSISPAQLMKRVKLREFFLDVFRANYDGRAVEEDTLNNRQQRTLELFLGLDSFMRRRGLTHHNQAYEHLPSYGEEFNLNQWRLFQIAYPLWKKKRKLYDFTDVLEHFADNVPDLGIDLLLVDEAQDLCSLQWRITERLVALSRDSVIAGDDDQAIFAWCGADVPRFLSFKVDEEIVLNQSYRLPKLVHVKALEVLKHIRSRKPKTFLPSSHAGVIGYDKDIFSILPTDGRTCLLMALSNRLLREMADSLIDAGVFFEATASKYFKQHDLSDILMFFDFKTGKRDTLPSRFVATHLHKVLPDNTIVSMMIKGKNITLRSDHFMLKRVKQMTIHDMFTHIPATEWAPLSRHYTKYGNLTPFIRLNTPFKEKGGEADIVGVHLGLPRQVVNRDFFDPDSTHRAVYVMFTRAKHELHFLYHQKPDSYTF